MGRGSIECLSFFKNLFCSKIFRIEKPFLLNASLFSKTFLLDLSLFIQKPLLFAPKNTKVKKAQMCKSMAVITSVEDGGFLLRIEVNWMEA